MLQQNDEGDRERPLTLYVTLSVSIYLSFHIVAPHHSPKVVLLGQFDKDEHNYPDFLWVDNNYCGLQLFILIVYFVLYTRRTYHTGDKHPYVYLDDVLSVVDNVNIEFAWKRAKIVYIKLKKVIYAFN